MQNACKWWKRAILIFCKTFGLDFTLLQISRRRHNSLHFAAVLRPRALHCHLNMFTSVRSTARVSWDCLYSLSLSLSRVKASWRWVTQMLTADRAARVRSRSHRPTPPFRPPRALAGPGHLLPYDSSPRARQRQRTWTGWASTAWSPTHSSTARGRPHTASAFGALTWAIRRSARHLNSSWLFWYEPSFARQITARDSVSTHIFLNPFISMQYNK